MSVLWNNGNVSDVVYTHTYDKDSIMIQKWRYYGRKNSGRYGRKD